MFLWTIWVLDVSLMLKTYKLVHTTVFTCKGTPVVFNCWKHLNVSNCVDLWAGWACVPVTDTHASETKLAPHCVTCGRSITFLYTRHKAWTRISAARSSAGVLVCWDLLKLMCKILEHASKIVLPIFHNQWWLYVWDQYLSAVQINWQKNVKLKK